MRSHKGALRKEPDRANRFECNQYGYCLHCRCRYLGMRGVDHLDVEGPDVSSASKLSGDGCSCLTRRRGASVLAGTCEAPFVYTVCQRFVVLTISDSDAGTRGPLNGPVSILLTMHRLGA